MSSALSALSPLPYDPDHKYQLSFGSGMYEGQSAYALGFHYYTSDSILFNVGVAGANGDSSLMGNIGITYKFGGPKTTKNADNKESDTQIQQLQTQLDNLQDQNQKLQEQFDQLKQQINQN
jgi:TolA-binding protein